MPIPELSQGSTKPFCEHSGLVSRCHHAHLFPSPANSFGPVSFYIPGGLHAALGTIKGCWSHCRPDPSGAVVTGARVAVTDVDRGIEATFTTNDEGQYVASPLRIGRYSVTVEKQGFKKAVAGPVQVRSVLHYRLWRHGSVPRSSTNARIIPAAGNRKSRRSCWGSTVERRAKSVSSNYESPEPLFRHESGRSNVYLTRFSHSAPTARFRSLEGRTIRKDGKKLHYFDNS